VAINVALQDRIQRDDLRVSPATMRSSAQKRPRSMRHSLPRQRDKCALKKKKKKKKKKNQKQNRIFFYFYLTFLRFLMQMNSQCDSTISNVASSRSTAINVPRGEKATLAGAEIGNGTHRTR
jgi:hypothetical protein